jgi:hypothetical protein
MSCLPRHHSRQFVDLAAGLRSLFCLAQLQSIGSALNPGAFADTDLRRMFFSGYILLPLYRPLR